MKAWRVESFTGASGLQLRELPTPRPERGQVLVRLRAASLNYRDQLILKGAYRDWTKPQVVLGSDGAGVQPGDGCGERSGGVGG